MGGFFHVYRLIYKKKVSQSSCWVEDDTALTEKALIKYLLSELNSFFFFCRQR